MTVVRSVVRSFFDLLVGLPGLIYLFAVLGATGTVFAPRGFTAAFVESSLPAMAGVSFSLFGFGVTALSILTSLKATPFFEKLQETDFQTWKNLVGSFLHMVTIFAMLGIFSFSITKDRIIALQGGEYNAVLFIYIALFLLAFLATAIAIYLLRGVANVKPPAPTPTISPVDPSFLNPGSTAASQGVTPISGGTP
ncbi:hypothetical protein GO986_08790 [Deinococcus sp. HMF7620]|uniref:Uncharacterized protein n=1 Tax=Deinococcus arboris TaxID=2682977 RepID=A0A7C9M8E6_9DEIO|nr:hypothetical protein [Deinococcus arboris]MVN86859.1 hypothetical protein [Deinococcus arboris]